MSIRTVCVYCGSSTRADPVYLDAAEALGRNLAKESATVVYGGGGVGGMGRLADGALSEGGRVVGVIPRLMRERGWFHPGVTELREVADLHERKRALLAGADAVVALPGGSGTLDEVLEAISLKRLGLFLGPIVLVNVRGFFEPCVELLEWCIAERFMDPRHREMWRVVDDSGAVMDAIRTAPAWSRDAIEFAAI